MEACRRDHESHGRGHDAGKKEEPCSGVVAGASKAVSQVLVDREAAQFVEGSQKNESDCEAGENRADSHLQIT